MFPHLHAASVATRRPSRAHFHTVPTTMSEFTDNDDVLLACVVVVVLVVVMAQGALPSHSCHQYHAPTAWKFRCRFRRLAAPADLCQNL